MGNLIQNAKQENIVMDKPIKCSSNWKFHVYIFLSFHLTYLHDVQEIWSETK